MKQEGAKDTEYRRKRKRNCGGDEEKGQRESKRKRTIDERDKAREWKRENHPTPLSSRGQGRCKLDIKTQIAFRQVTLCQKILDACREETTIPISL